MFVLIFGKIVRVTLGANVLLGCNSYNESPFGYTLGWHGPRRILTSTIYLSIYSSYSTYYWNCSSKALRGALPRT